MSNEPSNEDNAASEMGESPFAASVAHIAPATTETTETSKVIPGESSPSPFRPREIQWIPAVRFVFESPDWLPNMVLVFACAFIPVLGQIAIYGYMYGLIEALHRRPKAVYPKFEFKQFAAYCDRGVWVYVLVLMVALVLQLVLQLPIQFSVQFLLIFAISNQQAGLIAASILIPLLLLFLFTLTLGVSLFMTPLLLRAGLAPGFPQIFQFQWLRDFWRRVWMETLLCTLIFMTSFAGLCVFGMLTLCIGFLCFGPAIAFLSAHLNYQLYELYLERGGTPIALRPLPAEEPPVVISVFHALGDAAG